jgi:hypothetical protein
MGNCLGGSTINKPSGQVTIVNNYTYNYYDSGDKPKKRTTTYTSNPTYDTDGQYGKARGSSHRRPMITEA